MSLYDTPVPPRRLWLRLASGTMLVALLLAALAWFQRPDGYLHVFFLDTPGDAVLIQSPGGRYALIDGGADPPLLALRLGRLVPFWQRTLAATIVTHYDERRLPGQVAALERYHADLALAPLPLLSDDMDNTVREWARLLDEQQIPVRAAQPGMRLNLDGAVLTVLAVGEVSGAGLVLRLDYGTTGVLLDSSGSVGANTALLNQSPHVAVLAYPWERDMDQPLLEVWQPQAIVFTTGYQSDTPALLTFHERAQNNSAGYNRLYHPELDGTVELVSDGRRACLRRADEAPCMKGAR